MSFAGLVDLISEEPRFASVLKTAKLGALSSLDLVAAQHARPMIAAALAKETARPLLLVTSTYREAEQLTSAIGAVIGDSQVCYYPSWETLPHERLSPRSDTVGKRLAVLARLAGISELGAPKIVVAPIRSLLQPQIKGLGSLKPVLIAKGQEYDLSDLATQLVAIGYNRVDMVERRGDFAIRGGIVDIFVPTMERPVRIDFFGDEVDQITFFSLADQRSADEFLTQVSAPPCRELLLTDQVRARAKALIPAHPELAQMLEAISEGQYVEGIESLTPALVDELEFLVDSFPQDSMVLVSNPELVRARAVDLVRTSQEFLNAGWAAAASGGEAPIDLGASAYQNLADIRAHALSRGMSWWSLSGFSHGPDETVDQPSLDSPVDDSAPSASVDIVAADQVVLPVFEVQSWKGDTDAAVKKLAEEVKSGWRVVLSVEGKGIASRMAEVLKNYDLGASIVADIPTAPKPGVVTVVVSNLRFGFSAPNSKLLLVTTGDISGQAVSDRPSRKMPARRKNQISPLDLKPGDPVVHEHHGVGRFVEIVNRVVAGASRDYLVIEYASAKRGQPRDRLFVPMDQLDYVTRYVGSESPTLDKMGGADWKARKAKAKKAVRQIAAELIKLYAARQASVGFAFSADTVWQREMEDAFNYTETPDQLEAIEQVKHDMERTVPMDRLICGDVGYGKTEIAVRAAFKAVQDGKQVAVLVPTTLLVKQHYQTFADRYMGFPVKVAQLSRFQSASETNKVLDDLQVGRVDVVVGTHRLLSDQVQFKDLGLVIIDEEQRFGVEHKEALKKLRVNVDVLSMSATPIPRTLEMAITGIREMSVIATPPEERHPVLTFAGPWDQGQVVAAIRRELAREGQVFYLHNKVRSIDKAASQLRQWIPEARVVTAHGQMGERQLEKVMEAFWAREADVLVCTTIVEAGLDISSANTLIVESSENMGLSQLHQLRGRVGRGRERGYAYLLYPADRPLSETAHQRISTMAATTDLGAGMAIAMKDLEIRGAGNLLGAEQSGHIADVGFDLYLRLVGQAVQDYRSGEEQVDQSVRIELPVTANLPSEYIGSQRLGLEMYKRLAEVKSERDIAEVSAEMVDRFGPIPPAAQALLEVAKFRLLCRAAELSEVVIQGNFVRFSPADLPQSRQLRLQRMYPGSRYNSQTGIILVPKPTTARIGGQPLTDSAILDWATGFIMAIFEPKLPAVKPAQNGEGVKTKSVAAGRRAAKPGKPRKDTV